MLRSKDFKIKVVFFLYFCSSISVGSNGKVVKKKESFTQKRQLEPVSEFPPTESYPSTETFDLKDFEDLGMETPTETIKVVPHESEMESSKQFPGDLLASANNLHSLTSDEDDDSNDGIKPLDVEEMNVKESPGETAGPKTLTFSDLAQYLKDGRVPSQMESNSASLPTSSSSGNSPNGAVYSPDSSMGYGSAFPAASYSISSPNSEDNYVQPGGSGAKYLATGAPGPAEFYLKSKGSPAKYVHSGGKAPQYLPPGGFRTKKKPSASISWPGSRNTALPIYHESKYHPATPNPIDQQINSQFSPGGPDSTNAVDSESLAIPEVDCQTCATCSGCPEAVIKISIPVDCLKCPECAECGGRKVPENLVTNCCEKSVISIGKDNCPVCPVFDLTYCRAFSRDVEEKSGVNFLLQVGVILPWEEEMSSPSSVKFQTIRRKIQDLVLKTYVDHPTYQDTLMLSLKSMKGITVAECLIRFSKHGKGVMQRLYRAFTCGCGCELIDNSVLIINSINNTELIGRCPAACLVPNACATSSLDTSHCDPRCCAGSTMAIVPISNLVPVQQVLPTDFPVFNPMLSRCGENCPAFCMPLCSPECCGMNLPHFRRNAISTVDSRIKSEETLDSQK